MALSSFLGEELQDVALELQDEVGANVGDEICLVWGSGARGVVIAGGAGTDDYGAPVRTNTGGSRPDQNPVLLGVYYCRISHSADGVVQDFSGQNVTVLQWVVTLNENQKPVIEADSVITRCIKRVVSLEIANLGWRASTIYATGAQEMPANLTRLATPSTRCSYEAVVGGQSGQVEPNFPTVKNATVVDGSITWKCLGRMEELQVKDPGGIDTIPVERVVGCIELKV